MDNTILEYLLKTIPLLISAIALFIKPNKTSINKKVTLREDYNFSKIFLSEEGFNSMPDYLLEKGYQAISGKQLKASEIRFLFNTHDPLSKFQLFEKAEKHLTLAITENGVRTLTYKNEYTAKKLKKIEQINFIAYFTTAILSAIPMIFLGDIMKKWGVNGLWTSLLWSIPFGFIAYNYLREHRNLSTAKYIVRHSWREKVTNSSIRF